MKSVAVLLVSFAASSALACGELVTLQTHAGTTTRYALTVPKSASAALVLLPGGGGHANLGPDGCARKLAGNSLIRSQALFHKEGLATALVDAPSDYTGADGLGGFRAQPAHAEDLGKVIADLRARLKLPVWLVGTSRGTISAANAAGRLAGAAAPDGIVLTSSVTVGTSGGRLPWTAQTVFDARLHAIRQPALLVAHASDGCFRSPPSGLEGIADRLKSERLQKIVVTGGSPGKGNACEGRSPHGFNGLEAEVAAGIARFVRGGRY